MTIGGSTAADLLASLPPRTNQAPRITPDESLAHLDKVGGLIAAQGADALLISAGDSVLYFAGIPQGATERLVALLVPVEGDPIIICASFEQGSLEAALTIPADLRLWEEDEEPVALVADALPASERLLLDPLLPYGVAVALDSVCALTLGSGAQTLPDDQERRRTGNAVPGQGG